MHITKTLAVVASLVFCTSALAQNKPAKKPHVMRTRTAEQSAEKQEAIDRLWESLGKPAVSDDEREAIIARCFA